MFYATGCCLVGSLVAKLVSGRGLILVDVVLCGMSLDFGALYTVVTFLLDAAEKQFIQITVALEPPWFSEVPFAAFALHRAGEC